VARVVTGARGRLDGAEEGPALRRSHRDEPRWGFPR